MTGEAPDPSDYQRVAYGSTLRNAIRASGKTQRQVARAVNVSEPHLSLILAGQRLPRSDVAEALVTLLGDHGTQLTEVYRSAVGDASPTQTSAQPVPEGLENLLRAMRRLADELPYAQPSRHRVSLSTVYVRQSVASPFEIRRNPDPDLDEAALIDQDRRVFALARPFGEVFEQHEHLVIEGAAGLGKSTLGRHLVGELTDVVLADRDDPTERLVPVMVPARTLAARLDGRDWTEALRESITAEYGSLGVRIPPAEVFARKVGDTRWMVIVDALDEIPEPADREKLLNALGVRMSTSGPCRFLVTTRPLSPGEIERLKDPRVGFFELQPFDRKALEQFAEQRFNPDGTTEGALVRAEFLGQVDAAGLEQVLVVPLLASVAAQVFEAHRGRPLPASRYELYEEYIAQFATARDASAEAVFAAMGHSKLNAWLDAHRTDLLERLAVEHIGSETPLSAVARQFLLDQGAPLPARLPTGWEAMLGDWLSRTGVIGRHGPRLRFLHQTFAEHLAATAEARGLPVSFDPDHPAWAERLTRFLLDDENARRILLHFLHLRGPGTGPVAYLQGRGQAEREHAGVLIAQGAPCADGELDAYLTLVRRQALAGTWTDFRPLAALARHPAVHDALVRLLRDEQVDDGTRITIADVLRNRWAEGRFESAALLRSMVESAQQPPSRRCAAAEVLVRLGAEHRRTVVPVMIDLAADPGTAADERRHAARTLAALGGEQREEAGRLLLTLARSPGIGMWKRQEAANELAKLDGGHRVMAADLLFGIATDATAEADDRRSAAESLAGLGGECRDRAVTALRRLGDDVFGATETERLFARAVAEAMEPDGLQRAIELLHRVADSPLSPLPWRLPAIEKLAELGGDHRAHAARLYHQIALNRGEGPPNRTYAASRLALRGVRYRALTVETLTSLTADRTLGSFYRFGVAEMLIKIDPAHRAAAIGIFSEVATSPTAELSIRLQAAVEWAKLGDQQRDQVQALFRSYLDDPFALPAVRILAGAVLTALDPDRHRSAASELRQLARSMVGDEPARLIAVGALIQLGDDALTVAAEVLGAVATDATREPGDRLLTIRSLLDLGGVHRVRAADAMRALVADLPPREEALTNNTDLVSRLPQQMAGDSSPAWAVDTLCRIVTNLMVDPYDRLYAAHALVRLGQAHAVHGIEALHALVGDPSVDGAARAYVFSSLARLDPRQSGDTDALVAALIQDPLLNAEERCDTARELAKLGGAVRQSVARALRGTIEINGLRERDRAMVLAHAEALDAGTDEPIVAILQEIAGDSNADAERRLHAAQALGELRPDQQSRVLEVYRTAGTSRRSRSWRSSVARQLARLDGPDRTRAAGMFQDIALDPTAPIGLRRRALLDWGGFSHGPGSDLATCLHRLATEPGVAADERIATATHLAEHDLRSAVEALTEIASDPLNTLTDRIEATYHRARLDSGEIAAIVEDLSAVLLDRHASPEDRAVAAAAFCRLRPGSRVVVVSLLSELLTTPGVDDRLGTIRVLLEPGPEALTQAVDTLARIVADPGAADDVRLDATRQWARLGAAQRPPVAAALRDLVTDPTLDPRTRIEAAVELARLGLEHHTTAVRDLLRLGVDPTVAAHHRVEALAATARMQLPGVRSEPVGQLVATAADPTVDLVARCDAATEAARFSTEGRQRVAPVLAEIATRPALHPRIRQRAAGELAALGGEYRTAGLDTLLRLTAEPGVAAGVHGDTDTRALLLVEAAALDPELRDSAAEALNQAAADRTVPSVRRLAAARELADLGDAHVDAAARHLVALVEDAAVSPQDRLDAAWELLECGTVPRERVIGLLRDLAGDGALDPAERVLVAERLAELGPGGVGEAIRQLRGLLTDRAAPGAHRLDAAWTLARFGTPARAEVAEQLSVMATESDTGIWPRLGTLHLLAHLGPTARRTAAALLTELVESPAAVGLPQAIGCAQLAGIDERHHLRAVELLTSVATRQDDRTGWERLQAVHVLQRLTPDHRERSAALLRTIADDRDLRVWARRQAAELLARHGKAHRDEAVALLSTMADESGADPWERAEAAHALATLDPASGDRGATALLGLVTDPSIPVDQLRFAAELVLSSSSGTAAGRSARDAAIDALRRLARDRSCDARERRHAALALIRFGSPAGEEPLALLSRLAADPDGPPLQRALACANLSVVRPAERPAAAQALLTVAHDPAEPARHRRRAAEALTDLANTTSPDGLAVLRVLADSPLAIPFEQAMARVLLALWDATRRRDAVVAMGRLDEATLDAGQRRQLARAWAAQCPGHRWDTARRLRMMVTDPASSPSERRRAAATLAKVLGISGRVVTSSPDSDPATVYL